MPTPRATHAPPLAIEQKLAQTLGQWQHWQCSAPLTSLPTIDRQLSGGHSNYSFLTTGEQPCVVRIDGQDPQKHGMQRSVEWRCLQSGNAAGIAPAPVYFNPSLGSMVCTYLRPDTGVNPPDDSPQQASEARDLAATAHLLRNIHQLPGRRHRLNLQQRLNRYTHQAENARIEAPTHWLPIVESALDSLEDTHNTPVLCHNDLLQANRIWHGGNLYAIDWEYAAMGSALYDLAVVIEGDRLSANAANALVRTYLQQEPVPADIAAIERYRLIYLYLETLWYCLAEKHSMSTTWLEEQQSRMQQQLEAVNKA